MVVGGVGGQVELHLIGTGVVDVERRPDPVVGAGVERDERRVDGHRPCESAVGRPDEADLVPEDRQVVGPLVGERRVPLGEDGLLGHVVVEADAGPQVDVADDGDRSGVGGVVVAGGPRARQVARRGTVSVEHPDATEDRGLTAAACVSGEHEFMGA